MYKTQNKTNNNNFKIADIIVDQRKTRNQEVLNNKRIN